MILHNVTAEDTSQPWPVIPVIPQHCSFLDGSNLRPAWVCVKQGLQQHRGSVCPCVCVSMQQERLFHQEQESSWHTAPALSCETIASLLKADCKQASSSVTGDVVGAHCLCKAHIRKRKSCYRVPAKGESCSGAVRQMVQVQISSLSHHNNLLLRGEQMWIYCVRR